MNADITLTLSHEEAMQLAVFLGDYLNEVPDHEELLFSIYTKLSI